MVQVLVNDHIPTTSGLCAIYTRISSDPTGASQGVSRQFDECKQLAERKEWPAQTTFSDNDVSASGKVKRPGYEALLSAIAQGHISHLVIWHPDRLHRSPVELETFIDLVERHGVQIETVSAGAYDLTTPAGRMVARVVGAMARYEGEQKAARQKAQRLQAARQGKPAAHGRARTFGYSHDGLTLMDAEAQAIRWAASEILDGTTGTAVIQGLEAQGFTTSEGNRWRLSGLSRLLINPRLAGFRFVDGQRYEGAWPAILTVQQHLDLVSVYDAQKRQPSTLGRRSLLSGLAHCGRCGRKLTSGGTTNSVGGKNVRHRLYWCKDSAKQSGCNSLTIRQPNADEATRTLAIEAVLASKTDPTARDRLKDLEDAYYVRGTISHERFETLSNALRHKVSTTELDNALRGVERTTDALGQAWDDNSLQWRRQLLHALCSKVTIKPALKRGRGSKALDRIQPHWH